MRRRWAVASLALGAGALCLGASPPTREASERPIANPAQAAPQGGPRTNPSQAAPQVRPQRGPRTTTDDLEVSLERTGPLPTAPIVLGQPFGLTISARHAPGRIAEIPRALELGAAFVELKARRRHERRREGDREVDLYHLELIALELGEQTLPSIPVALGPLTQATPRLRLTVQSNLDPDERQVATATNPAALAALERMAAPNPPAAALTTPRVWPLVLAVGLLAATAATVAVARARRARGRGLALPAARPRPPHEVALERLRTLAAQAGVQPVKAVYVEISAVLRRYIGERYGFEGLDLTLEELMVKLVEVEHAGLDPARLRGVLLEADLVKFAKLEPSTQARSSAIDEAIALVEATRPEPERTGQDLEAAAGST